MMRLSAFGRVLVVVAMLIGATSAAARPCMTTTLMAWGRSGGSPFLDLGFGARPTNSATTHDSAQRSLRVHAGNGVTEPQALVVLGIVEAAWTQQVDVAGFPEPLGDGIEGGDARLDVYLVPLAQGVGGVTTAEADADPNDGRHASSAFIQIDPTLPPELLEVYLHHEFQHVLQFSIDTSENIMWFESTAVFWEVRTRPDVTDWILSVPDFQGQPQAPLFADSSLVDSDRYEYGAVLFALYLDEVHGDGQGTAIADVWNACAQPDAVVENEPDVVDALALSSIDVASAVADFAGWRALVGPLRVPTDGPEEVLPAETALVVAQLNAATLDGDTHTTAADEGPYALGCVVQSVTAPQNVSIMPLVVRANATLPDQMLSIATTTIDPVADTVARSFTTPAASHEVLVDVPAGNVFFAAFCDVTAADPDIDLAFRPITLSILRTDIEFPDAGPLTQDAGVPGDAGPDVVPPAMCGCQSSGNPKSMRGGLYVFGFAVALIAFVLRGVRHWRRRKLYRRNDS